MERRVAPVPAARPAEGGRRAEILDTAAELFASAGYVGASLKDVADACGILPGSLYHHFDSKEAIVVELLQRYRDDLDEVTRELLAAADGFGRGDAFARIRSLAIDIAACALRHRAALQLSQYEPHTGASEKFVELTQPRPDALTAAMRKVLESAAAAGYLKASVDLELLAGQLVESMLHTALLPLHREASATLVSTALCRLILQGVADHAPSDRELDRSAAMAAARAAIEEWPDPEVAAVNDRFALVRSVAREEFARRGYEGTTMRDIASAAGVGLGGVYRLVESKQALLVSIVGSFQGAIADAYDAVVAADAGVVAKLDALTWVNLNAAIRFDREFDIQRAWFRALPPPEPTGMFTALKKRRRQMRSLVEQGRADGELHAEGIPLDRLVACVRDLIWVPPQPGGPIDPAVALAHVRATLFRGAAYRRFA